MDKERTLGPAKDRRSVKGNYSRSRGNPRRGEGRDGGRVFYDITVKVKLTGWSPQSRSLCLNVDDETKRRKIVHVLDAESRRRRHLDSGTQRENLINRNLIIKSKCRRRQDSSVKHNSKRIVESEGRTMKKNQRPKLIVATSSGDEGQGRQGNELFIDDAPETTLAEPTRTIHLPGRVGGINHFLERIEDRYVKRGTTHPASQAEDRLPLDLLFLETTDWLLWLVKCTAGQEYFIVYELMMRHETLSSELRSAFYNPRDVGYINLEANFTKSGISSLREIIVPEVDLKRCLTIGKGFKRVFAPGQWVSIKRGLYRGDIGLVVEDLREEDSTTGVKVMVVPRLDYSDKDTDTLRSLSSKRKRRLRPSPQLFDPSQFIQEELVPHKTLHVFSYRSWRFEYGLLVKIYSENTLSPAREVPSSTAGLFLEAKNRGAGIEMESRPTSSLWRFNPGEPVLSTETGNYGTMTSSFDPFSAPSHPLVDFKDEGIQMVRVTTIIKVINLGQFVEVLAGIHSGKKGFVIAKNDALLGICFSTNSLDIQIHANSVTISTPDFLRTEIPWLNVRVKLLSGAFTGSPGTVKDVKVTSARRLAITVRLDNGHECTVGYHAVRELISSKLLLDHRPLERHQQEFNVEFPWKKIQVIIRSGRFAGHFAIVKNAWIDFRGALRLSLWVSSYNCSIEINSSALHEQITGLPLHVYCPLEGNQLKEFAVSPSLESMRTGPVPWVGLHVDIVKGEYKGQDGVIKNVNRYKVGPSRKLSGLRLAVERHVFTAIAATKVVEVDYDAIRFHKTKYRLCEVFKPTVKQSFYWPEHVYQKNLESPSNVDADSHQGSKTPLPNDFEREFIFCGSWSPNCPTPGQTPMYNLESPVPWTPASPDPVMPSRSRTPTPPFAPVLPGHWILHPKLVGIPIKVDISGGELNTSSKKDGLIVETVSGTDGIKVVYRRSPTKTVDVSYTVIESFHNRPSPSREKGLMVVARNHPEHIGKLVRRIHHFYDMEKTEGKHWLVVQRVDRSGPKERLVDEFFDLHPDDLEYVKETTEERKFSSSMLEFTRLDFSHNPAEIRRPHLCNNACSVPCRHVFL
ncbi:hypothetical protein BDP27DRAFT_1368531 [Rhodocollybia butyracea]|uniref:Chromatin elongation factor SPT5 n=1 Tax=Rhodocollybia butyracea TaxID=206335 RepID=A0A9P5U1E9_9AGAR|nr:hypothetical protein BDP27DRAFT_1368531 [Rhodocollybia butyracea]